MLTSHQKYLIKQLAEKAGPVKLAVYGLGWYGQGLVRELKNWPGIDPRMIITSMPAKGISILKELGIDQTKISVVNNSAEFKKAVSGNKYVVTSNQNLVNELRHIDIFFDATGDVSLGAFLAETVISQKINFVTVNTEMDATVGYYFSKMAKANEVIYSNSLGDQPGCLAKLADEVNSLGFEVAVVGNGKGFLNYHATKEDIMAYVIEGTTPQKIVSFTDGSKQSFELTVTANYFGFTPDVRGMHGVKTTREDLVKDISAKISKEGVIEYFMGKDKYMGMTIFVIGKRNEKYAMKDLAYLNRGSGPYYLFMRDYHLCYFETPITFAEIALFNKATIYPRFHTTDTIAVAKKNLIKGERLDGIGGYTAYGLVDKSETVRKDKLLPLGLAENAIVTRNIPIDTPISYDMVDFVEENNILTIRKKQDEMIFGK